MKQKYEIILDEDDDYCNLEMAIKGKDAYIALMHVRNRILDEGGENIVKLIDDILYEYGINLKIIN